MYTRKELDVYYKALGIETGEEEQRQAMNKIFSPPEEDPKDKRIRELEAENAELKERIKAADEAIKGLLKDLREAEC